MAKAILHNKDVARNLWGETVNTAYHTVNRVYFRPDTKKTPLSCEREGSQMLSISKSLEVLISFSRIERLRENLTPKVMKEYF